MKNRYSPTILLFIVWCTLLTAPYPACADDEDLPWVSKIVSAQGQIYVKRAGDTDWQPVTLEDTFYPGDTVRVASNSRAGLVFSNESMLRVDQHTTLVFNGIEKQKTFLLKLIEGAAYFFSRKSRSLKVTTPFVNGVVEGTEFLVTVRKEKSTITLYEGRVLAENAQGQLTMAKGQRITATRNTPPQLQTVVRPRDAVQWALYYPPIITFTKDFFPESSPSHWSTRLRRAIQAQEQGDDLQALAAIETLDNAIADARPYVYRAGLLLSLGRVEKAGQDIARALVLDDKNSTAMALQALIAVVQNRKADALHVAQQAVHLNPKSAAARLALAYALQAHFQLQDALEATRIVVQFEPRNHLAWARLAELYLSTGDLNNALTAAQKAAAIAPHLAHIRTVLGFAYLTQIKTKKAQAEFIRAIDLDSAAPLPRLGLGLAHIRQGDLETGRGQLEIAVSLDPDNALLRSYLGKAYFDEKRTPLDERQFEIAKTLDPMDPTPWFYDAIRKQSLNRPVEALQDLEKSIELNDNRAVYRSRLLLDQDLATRSTSIGRIYNDLGFHEKAIREGYSSLAIDPTNYSAHRLLADAYAARPRLKIARVSELLQSQLLQPLNITPVQPQMAESNLKIQEGVIPDSTAYNDYYSLFTGNDIHFAGDIVSGDHDTIGEELTLSGIYNQFSLSVGQFHYESNGSRENNTIDQNLHNIFIQSALTCKINLQAEYRYRDINHGDLRYALASEDPDSTMEYDAQNALMRVGLNVKPQNRSNIIASFMVQDNQEYEEYNTVATFMDTIFEIPTTVETDYDGWMGELQYIHTLPKIDVIVGGGYYDVDTDSLIDTGGPAPEKEDAQVQHANGYMYTKIRFHDRLTWTLGASYDALDDDQLEKKEAFNPKFGISWHPTLKATVRLAAFKTMKRTLIADQTIEPTQVAGFNQFYDDPNGTESNNHGIAIDYKLYHELSAGFEYFNRDITYPYGTRRESSEEDWEEDLYRGFLCWTPLKTIAISIDYYYEKFKRKKDREVAISIVPLEMDTQITPIQFSYFHPSGFFGKLKTSYVDQSVMPDDSSDEYIENEFFITDMNFGYRFQNRKGVLNAEIKNLFDTDFDFIGFDVRTPQNNNRPYFTPDKSFLLRLTLFF